MYTCMFLCSPIRCIAYGNNELNELNINPPQLPINHDYSLSNIVITNQEVKDAILHIDPSKASGPDKLSPRLLKEGVNVLSQPLARMFNKLISTSIFPKSWKLANVTPIYKKANPADPSNYRPISLLVSGN